MSNSMDGTTDSVRAFVEQSRSPSFRLKAKSCEFGLIPLKWMAARSFLLSLAAWRCRWRAGEVRK